MTIFDCVRDNANRLIEQIVQSQNPETLSIICDICRQKDECNSCPVQQAWDKYHEAIFQSVFK